MAKIKGNKKNNALKGTKKIDEMDGRAGDDSLLGDKGNDRLFGRAGNDTFDGSVGDDVMKGGGGNDLFFAGKGKDKFIGGKGIDSVSYALSKLGVAVSLLDGTGEAGALSDTFKGIENVDGSAFDDAIEGNAAANLFRGLGGNDFLEGGAGDDTLEGGEGNDTVNGGDGNDKLQGGLGNDKVNGGAGNDVVDGGDGDDIMNGGDGNDTFVTGNGKDAFIGGAGIDSLSYAASKKGVSIDLATGKGKGGADGDTYSGIENVDGGDGGDQLTGNGAANVLRGGKGDDALLGGGGNDKLFGGDSNDVFMGEAGADAFFGGSGVDIVYYFQELTGVVVNLATGKGGGAAAGDTYDGIEGVFGTVFGDTITGNGADNFFLTGDGGDKVTGGGGKDRIDAGEGADTLNGEAGDDVLGPGEDSDPDTVIGGSGVDWVVYVDSLSDITVNLAGGTGSGGAVGDTYNGVENVAGGEGNDMLRPAAGGMAYGSGGDDIVVDWTGTEVLRGGLGNDTLTDALFGVDDGLKDVFFLEFLGTPLAGFDTVSGFNQGTDLFWLSDNGARGSGGFPDLAHNAQGNPLAGRVVNDNDMNGVGNATQNYAQLIFEKDSKFLWYDYDGTGCEAPLKIAQIMGFGGNLATSDFKVVADPMSFFSDGISI